MEKQSLSHNYSIIPPAVRGGFFAIFFAVLFIISFVNCYGALFEPPVENGSFEEYELSPGSYRNAVETWFNYGWAWEEHEEAPDFPPTPYGNQWGGLGDGGVIYQQIGTWDTQQEYEISALLGHRGDRDWNELEVSLWVGGNSGNVGDGMTLTGAGATKVDSITLNPFASQPSSYIGTEEANFSLDCGAGFAIGDPMWIQLSATGGVQHFVDNIQVKSAVGTRDFYPQNDDDHIGLDVLLTWDTQYASDPKFNLYFGTDPGAWDVELSDYAETSYDPVLDYATTYYWRVDLVVGGQTYPGQLLSFTTGGKASDPYPADGTEDIEIGQVNLGWVGDSFATSYRVYTGTSLPPTEMVEVGSPGLSNFHVSKELTTYYWRVDEYVDDVLISNGDIWSFTTRTKPRPCLPGDLTGDCRVNLMDLLIVADNWLQEDTSIGDLSDDGKVNLDDLAVLLANWNNEGKLSIVISEFSAVNKSTLPLSAGELLDEDGDSSDWVEIHNMTDSTVNMAGWYLSSNKKDLKGWEFPEVTIPADGYLLVFASGKNRRDPASELHTDFSLAGVGEYLGLVEPDGVTVAYDYKVFPQQYAHITFGLSDTGMSSQTETVLIGEHVPATAFIPTDDSLGLTWTEVDFDDSSWQVGQTGVGYDTGTRYTPLLGLDVLGMRNVNETVYVRIPFQVDDVSSIDKLTLRLKYEDGFVAYLNGNNVVAQNNNPDLAELTWDSGSTANHDDSVAEVAEEFDITVSKGYLRQGENVLAIHGLNWQLDSSDLLILPQLTSVESDSFDLGTLASGYFFSPTPGAVNSAAITNLGPSIMEVTDNPPRPANNEGLTITARIEKTLADINTVVLRYRVMYGNDVTVAMLDDGTSGDGAAGDGVFAATIPANASGAGDMVRWYITASDVGGKTSRAPLFPYPNDSAEYFGTVIADFSTQSLMPVIEWFTTNPSGTEGGGARASVYYDGLFYDNIWIHNRGGSTARTGTTSGMTKAHFKFNFNTGQKFRYDPDYPRVNEFNLNHTYSDKAYLRQALAYQLYDLCGCPGSESFPMRAHRNGAFHSVMIFIEEPEEEMLEREGLDPRGALYKMYNTFTSPSGEKKTRDWEGTSDLSAFMNGINQTGTAKHNYIMDAVDMPRMIGYLVGTVITHQNDHPHKNHYLYRDSEGSGEWFFMPWDHDMTMGSNWTGSSYHDYIYAADDQVPGRSTSVKPSHPFIGKADCQEWNNHWNRLTDALLNDTTFRQMYLRRLRTVMDELLKPPGTPYSELVIENRIDEMVAQIEASVNEDFNRWVSPGWSWGGQGGYPRYQSFEYAINVIKNDYLDVRRTHLFVTHNVDNVASYPISNSFSAQIPNAQPADALLSFGRVEFNPPSFNQDEEFIRINNNNSYAVDISGWKLRDAVEHTFLEGTVIPAGSKIFVTPDTATFRARTETPRGGEGHFVQGNYKGHLSSWGETIDLFDQGGRLVTSVTYQGDPSDAQRYLRITEVMYNPNVSGSSDPQAYEYVELKNIGDSNLDLMGLSFTEGITYYFTGLADTVVLAPGEYLIVAKNPTAFSSYYTTVPEGTVVLGPYTGQFSNSGERVKLEDHTHSTILEFGYNDTWFDITDGLGFSLTVRDDAATDLDLWDRKAGWRPSAAAGGSPGWDDSGVVPEAGAVVINEVMAHSHAIDPDWIELHNTTNSAIPIGGWFLSDSNNDLMKYEIADDVVIPKNGFVVFYEDEHFGNINDAGCHTAFALSENGDSVYLHSGQDGVLTGYSDEEDFGASETGVAFGRYQKSTGTFNFVSMSLDTPGDENAYPLVGPIVISEIMYHPADNADAEYIELLNISGGDVDLYDYVTNEPWKLADEGGFEFFFEPSVITIEAAERILVVKDRAAFNATFSVPAGTDIYEWGPDGSLSNNNERIQLSMPGDIDGFGVRQFIRVDRVVYDDNNGWPIEADGGGSALQRKVDSDYGNDVANWQEATATPGE